MPLKGQVALITGASRGIGRAIALELGRLGAIVVGTATSDAGSNGITSYLNEAQIKGAGVVLNVNDLKQIETVVETMQTQYGSISILVNNAGITRDNLLMRMKEEEWDEIMETDLKSIFRLSKAVLRGMVKARYGRIISIGSVVGSMGNAGQTNYASAKAGMLGFTKSLAREVGSRNITVNCIAPGFIDTDMTQSLDEKQRTALIDQIPVGRLGKSEDIANAVGFLALPQTNYVSGITLHVNGGMYMD